MSNSSQKGQLLILLIVAVVIAGAVLLVGGFKKVITHFTGQSVSSLTGDQDPQRSSLQLKTLKPRSVPCHHEDGTGLPADETCVCPEWKVQCVSQKCVKVYDPNTPSFTRPCTDFIGAPPGQIPDTYTQLNSICATDAIAPHDGIYCVAKPVIYLYPPQKTLIDVSVVTSGKVVVSDPHYPDSGWKQVLADPDGKLTYNGKGYTELFYESNVSNFIKPDDGIIIANSNLEEKLNEILQNLGLNNSEKKEFTDFWIPKLKNLNANYILFSIVDSATKEKIDKVVINPIPDTRIEFIAYFKPLDFPIAIEPLKLQSKPERIGFTEVEWGGVLDLENSTILD